MTRGQGDSPFLPRIGLAPTTTCQFALALPDPVALPLAPVLGLPDIATHARTNLKTAIAIERAVATRQRRGRH